MNFAIPIQTADGILESLYTAEEILNENLGINIQDLNYSLANYFGLSRPKGVLLVKVFPESPAAEAGLKEKDIITKVNGETIDNSMQLWNKLAKLTVGDQLQMKVLRNTVLRKINVQLKRPNFK